VNTFVKVRAREKQFKGKRTKAAAVAFEQERLVVGRQPTMGGRLQGLNIVPRGRLPGLKGPVNMVKIKRHASLLAVHGPRNDFEDASAGLVRLGSLVGFSFDRGWPINVFVPFFNGESLKRGLRLFEGRIKRSITAVAPERGGRPIVAADGVFLGAFVLYQFLHDRANVAIAGHAIQKSGFGNAVGVEVRHKQPGKKTEGKIKLAITFEILDLP
jgi:hypothetical protein